MTDRAAVRAKVLIVDDIAANRRAVGAVLESLGHELVFAESGKEALRCLLRDDYAVILLDVYMPGLDGFDTASLIKRRARCSDTPIIFLTAMGSDPSFIFKGYAQGAVDYLVKPFDADILRTKVRVFVDLWLKQENIRIQEADLRRRELALSESRYSHLMNVVPQCLWAARADGTIYMVNDYLRGYCGESAGAADWNAVFAESLHPADRESYERALDDSRRAKAPFEVEFRLRRHDGAYRWFLGRGAPEFGEAGEVSAWIYSAMDIEEQKAVEEKLRRTHAEKDTFIAMATHELRTPITTARAQAVLIKRRLEPAPDERALQGLTIIERQMDRMARLVDDLLDASRLRAGRLALELSDVDLAAQLREDCERIQATTAKHNIAVDAPASLPIVGDGPRLSQVFTNLLTNAVRYSPEGGAIDVTATRGPDHVSVAVRDRGIGIPEDKRQLVFEEFGAVHGARFGGLGLGLSIARGIVTQHGGDIWFESEPGVGTVFHVLLPLEAKVSIAVNASEKTEQAAP